MEEKVNLCRCLEGHGRKGRFMSMPCRTWKKTKNISSLVGHGPKGWLCLVLLDMEDNVRFVSLLCVTWKKRYYLCLVSLDMEEKVGLCGYGRKGRVKSLSCTTCKKRLVCVVVL